MKAYLLGFFISAAAFTATTFLINGLNYGNDIQTLGKAAAVFGILEVCVRPIIKILLLPFNFLTMGLLGGVGGLIILWIMTIVLPGFSLTDTTFPAVSIHNFAIPAYRLSVLFTAIISATVISLISWVFYWLTK